jgi:lipopolysaccharide biosynthesis regulator YciM
VIATAGEQWVVVLIILVFLFGLFLGARLPMPRRKGRGDRDPRQSPGYIRGMYAMLTGDVETAIENLSKVVELSSDPIEVYLALGNLYRQRGQIDRAIRVHQSLLTRAGLSEEDRVLALNALGMDFRTGGLMDRSMKTFRESLALSPKDPDALTHLVKLSEDLGEWGDAYDYAVRLHKVRRHRDPSIQSYLLAQKAQRLAEGGMHLRAAWDLHRAIRLYPENMMAYIFLARLRLKVGKPEKARRVLQKALRAIPHKSFMVLGLLKEVSLQTQDVAGYMQTLHSRAEEHHQKRAMLQLLQEYLDLKRRDQVMPLVRELVKHFGRSRLVQRTLWDLLRKGLLSQEEQDELTAMLAASDQMLDHFNCIYCGYKTLEILHRCPNCKEWHSFADGE